MRVEPLHHQDRALTPMEHRIVLIRRFHCLLANLLMVVQYQVQILRYRIIGCDQYFLQHRLIQPQDTSKQGREWLEPAG